MGSAKAAAVWRWANFLHCQLAAEECPLCINMDETNVRLHMPSIAGHLSLEARRRRKTAGGLKRNVTTGETRATLTHLMCICNDARLQAALPQILLVSEKRVSESVFATICESLPPHFHCFRQAKAWTNTDTMKRFAKLLRVALDRCAPSRQAILFADAYKAHISKPVLETYIQQRIHICLIPAKLTWALQPADTHVFARYKKALYNEVERMLVAKTNARVAWAELVNAILAVDKLCVTDGDWAKAFNDNGFAYNQRGISARCVEKLELAAGIFPLTPGLPTLSELQGIFPLRSTVPVVPLFSLLSDGNHVAAAKPVPRKKRLPETKEPPTENPWKGRTRSTSAQELPAQPTGTQASSSSDPWRPTLKLKRSTPEKKHPERQSPERLFIPL